MASITMRSQASMPGSDGDMEAYLLESILHHATGNLALRVRYDAEAKAMKFYTANRELMGESLKDTLWQVMAEEELLAGGLFSLQTPVNYRQHDAFIEHAAFIELQTAVMLDRHALHHAHIQARYEEITR